MRKLTCDCCGETLAEGENLYVDSVESASRLGIHRNLSDDYEYNSYDLCEKCTNDVVDFIKFRSLWSKN